MRRPAPAPSLTPIAPREGAGRARRLARVVEVAQFATGASRTQLGDALGRDGSKLIALSGDPKLSLVCGLARLLGWSSANVAHVIEAPDRPGPALDGAPFETLDRAALEAYRDGRYDAVGALTARMHACARSSTERARACRREIGAWEGQGWYTRALAAARQGLHHAPAGTSLRNQLEVNLANAHYCLGRLTEAEALAARVRDRFTPGAPLDRAGRAVLAFSLYLTGQVGRALGATDEGTDADRLRSARADLERSSAEHRSLGAEFRQPSYDGIARTCDGALIGLDVYLGSISPDEGIDRIGRGLEDVGEGDGLFGDSLESRGWWCIFACEIAGRHLSGDRACRVMAVMTNKAVEIAERLGNWSFWERVLRMELERRARAGLAEEPWTLDAEDVRVFAGVMARFDSFFEDGWRVLERAAFVG